MMYWSYTQKNSGYVLEATISGKVELFGGANGFTTNLDICGSRQPVSPLAAIHDNMVSSPMSRTGPFCHGQIFVSPKLRRGFDHEAKRISGKKMKKPFNDAAVDNSLRALARMLARHAAECDYEEQAKTMIKTPEEGP